ncbi:MAG: signal recognition particle protein [Legionellales bacterium]|nr:signal recognition particle protein [Legionellales bacterium]
MFDELTAKLTRAFKNVTGQGRFTAENMQGALQEVRLSLLEADVALPVVKLFIEKIKEKALGQDIDSSLKSNQALIKIIKEELIHLMGDKRVEFNYSTQPPAVCMMAGLQGSGKTTNCAKLALYLKETEKKKVMLVSVDVYRPAAITQLQILAESIGVDCFPTDAKEKPVKTIAQALDQAKKQFMDVVIIDTAGRLHIDDVMMDELKDIHHVAKPIETFFVVDAMTGQDAANTAKAFHEALPLTGVILTKMDGDARGGAALSVKHITGQPIKFMSFGEKVDSFEPFHPERVASRILGMGDILSLIEEVERKTDKKTSEKLAKKIKKGNGFDLDDFKQQLLQMNSMGGITGMLTKLPGMANVPQHAKNEVSDKSLAQTVAIINSMTPKERRLPKIIIGSRKRRIAMGSGTQIQDVNRLLKRFEQMQKMMQKISKPGGLKNMMRGVQGLPGMSQFLPDKD